MLQRLAQLEDFELIIIVEIEPDIDLPGLHWRHIAWPPDTEVEGLQQIDIGLMPLRDEPFEKGKSGLKAIQYMGVGIPAIVSPVGVNGLIVLDGKIGFHCTKGDEWIGRLRRLIRNRALRERLGAFARDHVVRNYSISSAIPRLLDVFEQVSPPRDRQAEP